jgi:hypothetical protein
MKVYFGPYKNYNKKTKTTPERKISIKIDRFDTWSMDHTLALIIHPMLVQLKATTRGAPSTDDEDVPEKFRSTKAKPKKNEWDTDSNHFKRWDWILDEMIWAFSQLIDEDAGDQFYSGKSQLLWQALDKDGKPIGKPITSSSKKYNNNKDVKLYSMVKGPKDTFKVDRKSMDAWEKRKRNGFRLFGKYYQALWD